MSRLPPYPTLRSISLSANSFPEQSLAGAAIGTIIGLASGSRRTLVVDAGGRVALSGGGDKLVVGLVPSAVADGPLTVVVREHFDRRLHRDTILTITVVGFQTEAAAVIAAMTGSPTAVQKGRVDRLITRLKVAGAWPLIDAFYIANFDDQSSRINWKQPGTHSQIKNGTLSFVPYKGFKSDGTTGYLDSTWNPTIHAVNFQQNSAILACYSWDAVIDGLFDAGVGGGLRMIGRSGGQISGRINSGSTINPYSPINSIGMNYLVRRDAVNAGGGKDDQTEVLLASASGAVSSGTLKMCGQIVASNFSARRIGMLFVGAGLSATMIAAVYRAISLYFREAGVMQDESTSVGTTISTNSATYAAMSSQVIPAVAVIGSYRFRANYGVAGQPPGTSGEGPGAFVRVTRSSDQGATYTFCAAWIPVQDGTSGVLDPHLLALNDGRLMVVAPYNGGGMRTVTAMIVDNPTDLPANWVWKGPYFLGYGFVGKPLYDGPNIFITFADTTSAAAPYTRPYQGLNLARITFCEGIPVAEIVSRVPDALGGTIKDYYECIVIRRADRSIFAAYRVNAQNYYYSINAADGAPGGWSEPAPFKTVPNPSSRMCINKSPSGNIFLGYNNNPSARRNMSLGLLSGDCMTLLRSFELDARTIPSQTYPDIAFDSLGNVCLDYDAGRGNTPNGSGGYYNELIANTIPEAGMLTGNPTKTTYTISS